MVDTIGYLNEVVFVAKANIGYGETEGNNRGKFMTAIGAPQGSSWCAAFVRYCFRRAAQRTKMYGPPFNSNTLGAKKLTKNIAAAGRRYKNPLEAVPGDVVCWHRGRLGWQGHIGLIVGVDNDGIITTVEGNVGAYPSKVRKFYHDVTKERLFTFASLLK